MCLLTFKRPCNWNDPETISIPAYSIPYGLWNNVAITMLNLCVALLWTQKQHRVWKILLGGLQLAVHDKTLVTSICADLKATVWIKFLANTLCWAVWSAEGGKLAHLHLLRSNSIEENRLKERTTWLSGIILFCFVFVFNGAELQGKFPTTSGETTLTLVQYFARAYISQTLLFASCSRFSVSVFLF